MKLHKITLFAGGLCLLEIVYSLYRWTIQYTDYSQAILGGLIGIVGLGFAYVYNWMREKDIEDMNQTKRLNALVDWWLHREDEAIREIAKGEDTEE